MGKPPFDPNKPFEVADKPPFDPSAPFEETRDLEQERPWYSISPSGIAQGLKNSLSTASVAAEHALQGASGGLLDEGVGLVSAAGRAAGLDSVDGQIGLAKGGPTLDWETLRDAYIAGRDHERNKLQKSKDDHPIAAGIGNVGGMIASPLNKLSSGMSLAKGGAVLGGVNAFGNSEADDLVDLAKDTAIGAGLGAGIGKGIEVASPYVAKGAGFVSDKTKDLAERFGGRALGAERGTIKSLGADKVKEAGRYALDNDVLSPFASTDDLIARNEALKAKGGAKMGEVYKAIDDVGGSTFNPENAAQSVDEKIGNFYRSPINRGEASQLDNTLESIRMRGDQNISLKEAQALKEELGKVANWKNKLTITDKERMARDAYGVVSKQIDDAVESGAKAIGSDDLLATLQEGKKLYGNASTASALLENKLAREEGNKLIGLTDWGVLGAGGAVAPLTGGASIPATAALFGAKKGLEKYGAQNAAIGLDKVSKALMRSPKMAQVYEQNPQAFQAMATSLEQKLSFFPEALPKAADQNKAPDKQSLLEQTQGTKYNQVLQNAASRGDDAFNAANYVLMARDPDYRKTINNKNKQKLGSDQ